LDFIHSCTLFSLNRDGRSVVPFVDIFVEILDSRYGRGNLDVDVAIESLRQIGIMGYDISIGELVIDSAFVKPLAVVSPSVDWIAVVV